MLTFTHFGFRIPDLGVKKASDPGSGSATLIASGRPPWLQPPSWWRRVCARPWRRNATRQWRCGAWRRGRRAPRPAPGGTTGRILPRQGDQLSGTIEHHGEKLSYNNNNYLLIINFLRCLLLLFMYFFRFRKKYGHPWECIIVDARCSEKCNYGSGSWNLRIQWKGIHSTARPHVNILQFLPLGSLSMLGVLYKQRRKCTFRGF